MKRSFARLASLAATAMLLFSPAVAARGEPATRPATAPGTAPGTAVPIDPADKDAVDAAVGKNVVILGTVATAEWSPTGKVLKIEFKGNDKTKLLAVAFVQTRPALDKKFGGNAAEKLGGRSVRVTGKLTSYTSRGNAKSVRPEVVIESVDQIEILDPK